MGESVAFPYLARLILRTASGCDVVAVKFSGACPGFPNFKTSPTKFFLEFSQVKALHLLQYVVHGFLDFRFVGFADVLRLYKVPFLGYGVGGFRCLFPYPVIPVQFPGTGAADSDKMTGANSVSYSPSFPHNLLPSVKASTPG